LFNSRLYSLVTQSFVFLEALLELESNSSLNRALLTLLKTSFFEKKPLSWKPVKYELVINTKLTEEFKRKFYFILICFHYISFFCFVEKKYKTKQTYFLFIQAISKIHKPWYIVLYIYIFFFYFLKKKLYLLLKKLFQIFNLYILIN
jgi:hypothetical protein